MRIDQDSPMKAALETIAARVNAGDLTGLDRLFSANFVLHDPSAPRWPRGREGVAAMIASFKGIHIEPLDMIEEGDRVCVRWRFSGERDGAPVIASCVAIYRFENGLIAEDWGVVIRAPWP